MKILCLGGEKSGKTAIISRCLDIPSSKQLETGQGVAIHVRGSLQFWDISGRFKQVSRSVHDYIFSLTNGILLVLDITSQEGVNDCLQWISLLRVYIRGNIPIILLANKADSTTKYVNSQTLDQIVTRYFLFDWFWTVGHAQFGDYDSRRGSQNKQLSINEVLDRLLKIIHMKEKEIQNHIHIFNQFEPILSTSLQQAPITVLRIDRYDGGEVEEPQSIEHKKILTGWKFYGGVMSREVAENYLNSSPIGSFLLRRSDINFQLRIVLVSDDLTIVHIPVKQMKQREEIIGDDTDTPLWGTRQPEASFCVGRKELKGMLFEDIFQILLEMKLDLQNGIKFMRVVNQNEIYYSLIK